MTPRRPSKRKAWGATLLVTALLSPASHARKFYVDDPLENEPEPIHVEKVARRRLSDVYDLFAGVLTRRGEQKTKARPIPAQAVNTLGEVPDNAWYTNRHYRHPMSIEELVRGPGDQNPPDAAGPLIVVSAKTEGITPGFVMEDSRGRRYNVKFDPSSNPEMATAADVIVSKFFYALGYNVPENYIVHFNRHQLRLGATATVKTLEGKRRRMTERDLTELFLKVPNKQGGRYRAVASFYLKGENVGEFRYHGTRADDPNDTVPHEHRRDLRGLGVFCAWLGHDDSRPINTLDMLVEEDGRRFIRHYLIDFGSTLGSASTGPNSPRSGNYLFSWKESSVEFMSLGLYVPRWARAHYPKIPAVGRFEAEVFDPETWVPEYRNPAFKNRLPDDAFWAAKQVMAFTDEQIRALVKTGQYSDARAEQWINECLIKRRDKIGKAFFSKVLPLDQFGVRDGRLVYEDLAVTHKLATPREYSVEWSQFNNAAETRTPISGTAGAALAAQLLSSPAGDYFVANISGNDKGKMVAVYLRHESSGFKVAGIDRTW
ncbi:MAG: hypothetical protein HY508_09605 [Acidobacteria bacterium]|nr:hypothetical protein [Acidobacteriota bacterium]